MKKLQTYHFHHIEVCNMCGCAASDAKILGMRLNQSQGKNPRSKSGISVSVCRCKECGLHFSQPLPVPESISDHYEVPPEEYWSNPEYFTFSDGYFARQLADAKRLLPFAEGMKALDIGVGIGKAVVAMKRAGFDVWGIEPSKPFVEKAREITGLDGSRLIHSEIETATFDQESFEFISFGAVLEHLYDPAGSIEKALDWLAPGGLIQLEVPSSEHTVSKILNSFFKMTGTNYVTNLSPMHSPYHLYEFSLDSFKAHGNKVGYGIAHHYVDVASIYNLPRIVHPMLRAWMEARETGMQLTVWLRKPEQ